MPIYFGDKIRKARKAAGMTQRQLADILEVSHTSISNWEKNLSRPDPDMIQHLCWMLNVQPNYFFSSDADENANADRKNIVRIASRNGSYKERSLTDEQYAAFEAMLDLLPDVEDDS